MNEYTQSLINGFDAVVTTVYQSTSDSQINICKYKVENEYWISIIDEAIHGGEVNYINITDKGLKILKSVLSELESEE